MFSLLSVGVVVPSCRCVPPPEPYWPLCGHWGRHGCAPGRRPEEIVFGPQGQAALINLDEAGQGMAVGC